MDKIRLLFLPLVDAGNVNAQSLNVREIALRLDPERFQVTLWYEHEPDPRLSGCPWIRLERLPEQRRTARILREMLGGYDIIAYIDYSPASYGFVHLPRVLRSRAKAVFHAEAPMAQITSPSRTLRFLYKGILPRCDVYTAITDFVGRDLQAAIKENVGYILPVGVDTKLFAPLQTRMNPSPVVLFAGSVTERKGPQLLVDAAARFPNARFRIVGAGRAGFDESLCRKIAESGLKNVTLEGTKTQTELLDIMRLSDIFLLPSRLEGIPKVSLEAAAAGLPCIVFRDYETPSVVDGVTGFQVKTNDEMMKALARLIENRELRERMGAAARQHIAQFDWDVVSRRWESAYLEIAEKRGHR